jgi:hypothetical protein
MVFFAINYYSMKNLFRAAIAVTVAAIIVSISVGQENLYSLLRISTSWDSITTGRFSSMIEMLHLISSSPLKGHGFGSLDSEVIVYPNNLFYFGIPLEIGIVGAAGVFGLFLYPHYLLFRHVGISRRRHFFRSLDLFDRWALTILFGLPFWLIGEFEVFRVSACNQLYVLVWALVMFRIKETLSKN